MTLVALSNEASNHPHASRQPKSRNKDFPQVKVIRAELIGSHECRCEEHERLAFGYAPVLAMCRELLAAGMSPDAALHVYRRGILALKVRAIGKAAQLVVEDSETGRPQFRLARPARRARTMCIASPVPLFENSNARQGGDQ
jgi:hypothetical protein